MFYKLEKVIDLVLHELMFQRNMTEVFVHKYFIHHIFKFMDMCG